MASVRKLVTWLLLKVNQAGSGLNSILHQLVDSAGNFTRTRTKDDADDDNDNDTSDGVVSTTNEMKQRPGGDGSRKTDGSVPAFAAFTHCKSLT